MLKTKSRQATYTDIEALPAHMTGEIIFGALHAHPRPAPPHTKVQFSLAGKIDGPFSKRPGGPAGWVFHIEPELHLGEHIVVPDIAGWRSERWSTPKGQSFITSAPDWLAEILSPSTEKIDRSSKLDIYASFGVKHCWYVHPDLRTLEVLALSGAAWTRVAAFKDDDKVAAPPFESHTFDLNSLWLEDDAPGAV